MFAKYIKTGETFPSFAAVFNINAAKDGQTASVVLADGAKTQEIVVPLTSAVMEHAATMAVIHTEVLDLTPAGIERIKKVYDHCHR